MKKEYDSLNHSKTHIRYHIIFSTKYGRESLKGIEEDIKRILIEISKKSKFSIISIGIDKNHVHMLIKGCPSISILQIVKRIKSISTNRLWKEKENHLKQFYWKKNYLWSRGYFCSTVGEISEKTIEEYIKTQG